MTTTRKLITLHLVANKMVARCARVEGGGKYDVGYVAGDLAPLQRPHNPHHRACEVSSHHNEQ